MNDREKRLSAALDMVTALHERLDDPAPLTRADIQGDLRWIKGYIEEAAMPPKSPIRQLFERLKEAA